MKSVVTTSARAASSRQTAASSPVSVPTRRSGWRGGGSVRRTCASSAGARLHAQPAPWLNWVRRRVGRESDMDAPYDRGPYDRGVTTVDPPSKDLRERPLSE